MGNRRTLRVEQDGKDFYVREVRPANPTWRAAKSDDPSAMHVLRGDLVQAIGTEEECTVTIPRLGLYGDSAANGEAWRAWFVAYCDIRGFAVQFPGAVAVAAHLAPDTRLSIAFRDGPPEASETTWARFLEANKDDDAEIRAAEATLAREGWVKLGGGAQPVYSITVLDHDGGTSG